jgi:DNA-binding response OmpR family regulator
LLGREDLRGGSVSEDERLFLVVDPDARTHRALESALTDGGGRVIVRESADQALEVLCSEPIELVIASTALTDGDGFRLCSMMRGEADFDAIPLIFIADDSSKSRRLEGFQAGAADYLSEPCFFAELQMRIEALLARSVRLDSDVAWTVTEGSLVDRSLVDILTEVEQNEQSGTLSVARDGRQAVVHFEDGQITGAVSGTLKDKEALLELVAWPTGEFVLRTVNGVDESATEPEEVVLVGMRPLEAWSEVVDGLPELRRVFERDAELVPEVAGFDGENVAGVYELCDGQKTLGEVISASSPDLVVTLRIVDHLVEDGWLEQVDSEADVPGPGIGEPKPDLARWIDPAGWSAAAVDGESQDVHVVPPPGESSKDEGEPTTEPGIETASADEGESAGDSQNEGDEPKDIETSAEKLEETAEASDVEVEAADDSDESLDSAESDGDSDESEPERLASEFDSEPDEEEISSVLKTDSEPELATDSQPMFDSEAANDDETESEDEDPPPNGEGGGDEKAPEAESSEGDLREAEGERDDKSDEQAETSADETDPHETLDLDSVPDPEEVQPDDSGDSQSDSLPAEASADSETAPTDVAPSGDTGGELEIDPATLLHEADPGHGDSGRDEEPAGPGPQLHDRHDPGTIERVELRLDRQGHGATQTDYTERDEQPPSERIEPKVPVEDEQAPEPAVDPDAQEELETVEIEEEVEGEGRLGPTEETPVTGLDAASPEAGAEYAARGDDSSSESDGAAGERAAPEEISTDELPRATRGTVGGGDSGETTDWSSLLVPALALVVLVAAVGYMVSDDLSAGDDGTDETASADTRETTGDSPVEGESAERGADDEEGAQPSDETEAMAQGSSVGIEDSDPGDPSLNIVEKTRQQARDVAGIVSETASNFSAGGSASADEATNDDIDDARLEQGSDESEESTEAAEDEPPGDEAEPGEPAEAKSEQRQTAESDENPDGEIGSKSGESSSDVEETAEDDETEQDDRKSSESSAGEKIDAIAGLIDLQEYAAAEQKLETLPGRLQEDAKVRDLYLDLAAGYQTESRDVAAAKGVYQEYLDLFPDGKYASDVRSILSRLESE